MSGIRDFINLVVAVGIAIVLFVVLFGGGFGTLWDMGSFISQVPAWLWVVLIILYVFSGGKKR